jgi:inorganic phosphate transporter, PiT family
MDIILVVLITLALAAGNGANDNFKGAATLLGSGVTDYRRALAFATIATSAGALASIVLANGLLATFSGRGIVPDAVAGSGVFLGSVGAGAAATVWLATRLGFPISTTHALVGSLLGAGLAAAPEVVNVAVALRVMFLPLLLSPLVAITLSVALVPLLRRLQRPTARQPMPCVCVPVAANAQSATLSSLHAPLLAVSSDPRCAPEQATVLVSLSAARSIDTLHYISAGAVSFARGLNDTPKIAALMVAVGAASPLSSSLAVAVAMAVGGWLAARRVSATMAHGITRMNPAEGLGGNLVTALLVIVASRWGLPVSTTHVSCGALFGIAASNGQGRAATIIAILGAWLVTLPLAAVVAFGIFTAISYAQH